MIHRSLIDVIIAKLFASKGIIIYGPRQVGKTTITRAIQQAYPDHKSLYINGDDLDVQQLRQPRLSILESLVQGYEIIIIDEAQRIRDIGLTLKLLIDTYPNKQFIATGSSSFDLANKISEPLTGRVYIYLLYPIGLQELYHGVWTDTMLEQRMIYGSYPTVVNGSGQDPRDYLKMIIDQYLYKDLLGYDGIQKYDLIVKILQALALQIGNEYSALEIARITGSNKDTVAKYISILEQAFVIKTLKPLYSNQRKEIKAHKKVYFLDLGIRNAVINNFNPLIMRNDVGQLWENLCFIERCKYLEYGSHRQNQYFWRESSGPEIDYIEQSDDHYDCREFKYSPKKGGSVPRSFADRYNVSSFDVIRTDTLKSFVMG